METLALVHLTVAYEDPNPPQLRSLDEIKLKLPSSAWIGLAGMILSLMVFTTAPEQAQAASCGGGGGSSHHGGGGGGGGSRPVKVSTNGSALRIRSGPGTGYGVIGGLSNGTTVSTTGRVSNGWIQLSNGGWIAGNWVASSGSSGGGGGGGGNRVATNGSALLMRNGPGGSIIGSLANGSRISLTGRYSGSWAQLSNGAWVSSRWIR
ncbi:SH3 domain-containing protein [Ancylothrix sp. C2]|uniref:SH3 domain-containing protein n=1 Tax=Ancylothrix sp. D3o TaxID=2953691 RepID=UPI0021BB6FF3|nr:SH3 domain-containing protein [Ancylothrix sp. D3o]MCT7952827.1 SH3 domain-containing protein [Ancylothrix sp. D3o]